MEVHTAGYVHTEADLKRERIEIADYEEKLKTLYDLAYAEALKEDDEHNAPKLQADFNKLVAIDDILMRKDPLRIVTVDEARRLKAEQEKSTGKLLDDIYELFIRIDSREKK